MFKKMRKKTLMLLTSILLIIACTNTIEVNLIEGILKIENNSPYNVSVRINNGKEITISSNQYCEKIW